MNQKFGNLNVVGALSRPDLMAESVLAAIKAAADPNDFGVTEIDPSFSDTAAFCEQYQTMPSQAANCVVIKASRGDKTWFAACMVLGNMKADVNGLVRRHLDARKASFAPMEEAVTLTRMEYGGITPVGLPTGWPILIDKAVAESDRLIIGSGLRRSKLIVSGKTLVSLSNATVLEGLGFLK